MANTFKLKILSLSEIIFDDDVEKVFTESISGKFEILKNHAPAIMSTIPCETTIIDKSGEKIRMFTSKGVLNIKNNEVLFCLDVAERVEDIDLERAKASKERAEKRLKDPDKYDIERAKLALAKAIKRIEIKSN